MCRGSFFGTGPSSAEGPVITGAALFTRTAHVKLFVQSGVRPSAAPFRGGRWRVTYKESITVTKLHPKFRLRAPRLEPKHGWLQPHASLFTPAARPHVCAA